MGGYNSGRRDGKNCTDDMRALDVRKLQQCGRLTPGQTFGWSWTRGCETVASINIHTNIGRVNLIYHTRSNGSEWQQMDYIVRLSWTSCNYGGERAWWICPAVGCGRRVAVLFGGKVYACRHCHKLAYRTQREQAHDRASSRADKLRKRLGWEAGILNGNGGKPKGMHWQTYWKLQAAHDSFVNQSLAGMAAKLGLVMGRLEGINLIADGI